MFLIYIKEKERLIDLNIISLFIFVVKPYSYKMLKLKCNKMIEILNHFY